MKQQFKRRPSASHAAVIRSAHLGLSHRSHTGHMLPKKHTSYPVLVMILLCVGVLLMGMTRLAMADALYGSGTDDVRVHASVPGPAPTMAATIDTPSDGTHFKATPIGVSGSCPLDTYVTLTRNGVFSGASLCDASGRWSLNTDLFAGANELLAQVYNTTDVPGPSSPKITVYYDKPVTAPPATDTGSITTPTTPKTGPNAVTSSNPAYSQPVVEPLLLKTNFRYRGHYSGVTTSWQFSISGGTAPYAVVIDWGDGTNKVISLSQAGEFSVNHTYKNAGKYHGSYPVTVNASDASDNQTMLQLLSIINNRPTVAAGVTRGSGTSGFGWAAEYGQYIRGSLKYVWPSYLVVVLMLTSFWLGERREYNYLKPQLRRRRHA